MFLTQKEADFLLQMEKCQTGTGNLHFPALGGKISVPLVSVDGREKFVLDVNRGRINLRKFTYQSRSRQVVILARLDTGGAPHRNPDGTEVGGCHLHLYRERYQDKWAYPVPVEYFANLNDGVKTFDDFMTYCNVVDRPTIERGLTT